jgi:hypothetical protein
MAVSGDEEILRLQIAMDDALAVRCRETPGNLQSVVDGILLPDRTGVEFPAQCFPLEKLHHCVGDAVLASEIVNREDVLMGQRSDRFRFALEAGQRVGVGCNGLREDLNRHVPVEFPIARAVDLTHTAGAERRDDLEGPETCAGCEGQAVDYTSRRTQKTFAPRVVRVTSRRQDQKEAVNGRKRMPIVCVANWQNRKELAVRGDDW